MQACNRLYKIKTAEFTQPRNHSIVTRPFPYQLEGRVRAQDCGIVDNQSLNVEFEGLNQTGKHKHSYFMHPCG